MNRLAWWRWRIPVICTLVALFALLVTVHAADAGTAAGSPPVVAEPAGGEPIPDDETAYTDIAYGAEGDNVLALQMRLKELSYYTEDMVLAPSRFDLDTQRAVELFCEYNNIAYSGSGVSAAVQSIIFSDSAVEYAPAEIEQPLSQRLLAYMTQQVPMFGTSLPMYVIWIFSVILIVAILVLCVYFFVPGRGAEEPQEMPTPRYWRRSILRADVNLPDPENNSSQGRLVGFQIHFGSETSNIQRACDPIITVGRNEDCSVRLDPQDTMVSGRHCEIYFQGAVLMLKDYSRNGTYVNGRLISHSECRLNTGDRLTIGSHQLFIW